MTLVHTLQCPDCPNLLATPESMRLHRWLAHGVKELPEAGGGFSRHRKPVDSQP